jgi:hypothetical protein
MEKVKNREDFDSRKIDLMSCKLFERIWVLIYSDQNVDLMLNKMLVGCTVSNQGQI